MKLPIWAKDRAGNYKVSLYKQLHEENGLFYSKYTTGVQLSVLRAAKAIPAPF